MAAAKDKEVVDAIKESIANAAKKSAEAKTIEEANGWQGIINQQNQALRNLVAEQ